MTGILMLESLTRGNTLKQGDKTPLTYKLLDADGDNLNVAGKTATVRLVHPNYLTIGYEKSGLLVSQDDTVTFTIDNVIPARKYNVEIIVDNKFVFPSRSVESKFTIDKSTLGTESNIIEIIGKDVLIQAVKSQVDAELQPLVTTLQSAEQAETQRASAESVRASAEQQREIDHANRSAELDSKADKVALNNLVANGNFINGVQNIQLSQGARIENQKLIYAHGTSGSTVRYFTKRLNTDWYYFYIKYNTNETTNAYQLANNQGGVYSINSSSTFHSHRRTYPALANISIYGGQNATHDLVVDYYVALNLTEIFGAGNEPSKEEMDELIKVTGYIDGEYTLNNKEMLGHLMKGIGEKADKKQEDWITPTLLNGTTGTVQYRKNELGMVELSGSVSTPNVSLQTFVMPIGYRPRATFSNAVTTRDNNNIYRLMIGSSGSTFINVTNTVVDLTGISFEAGG